MENQSLSDLSRTETFCRGCNGAKALGNVVCWKCWRREDCPFKYFQGSLELWLETVKQPSKN